MTQEKGYIVILKDESKGKKALHTVSDSRFGTRRSMTDFDNATIYQTEWEANSAADRYVFHSKTITKDDLEIKEAVKTIDVVVK